MPLFATHIAKNALYHLSHVALILLILFTGATALAQDEVFAVDLPGELKWSNVTPIGSLLVGGAEYLAHYQSDGELLWVRDDVRNLAAFNVRPVPELPYIVVSELVGKAPMESKLQVLDMMSGETLWDTGVTNGSNLGGYAIPARGSVVFARDIGGEKDIKPGVYISEFDLQSGEEKWRTRLGPTGTLPRHNIDDNGFISGQDLSGHPPPMVVGDSLLLFAGDIYSFDLNDGSLQWHYKLKAGHRSLKRTYARPVLVRQTLYAASTKRVVALNVNDGTEIWKSKVSKAAIPELKVVGDLLVGRYGGTFSNGKEMTQLKPFGAFVLSLEDGKKRWEWKKAKDSITNLAIFPEENRIALADKKRLYALELDATKAVVANKEDLEFKRKMGTADVAAKGLGAVGGFLTGGLAGSAKGMSGGDRSDPPLDISQYGSQLVVRGKYHVLAYNLDSRSTAWSVEFAPPGISGLALVAMGAVTAGMSYAYADQAHSTTSSSTANSLMASTSNLNNAFQDMASERSAASERDFSVAFFLTQEEDDRYLVGLDLQSGERVGAITMKEKEPIFQVDALVNRVYYFEGETRLIGYDFPSM